MSEAGRTEADLRQLQPVADLHEPVAVRDAQALEEQFAMSPVLLRPHDRDAAQDAPAWIVAVEQEGGETLALVIRGPRDQDEMRRLACAGDEPFMALDHPIVSVAPGGGAHHRGV